MIRLSPFTVCVILLAAVYFIYAPGLSGGFIFDDVMNFVKIDVYQSFEGFEALKNYVLSNQTGFLKRPISTLSFLLSASEWPAKPYYFKIGNIILHILNGGLLFVASKMILKVLKVKITDVNKIALLSALIWVLHPFFVSTVLYANQRQAMLPVTFTLLGMIVYLKARVLVASKTKAGLLSLYASVFLFTTLATLSKENGVVLPLLILILELVVNKNSTLKPLATIHKLVLFYIPIAVVAMALAYKFPDWLRFYENRNFSLYERLLSQPRAITTYLYHLFIPSYFTEGVYTDGFMKSTGLLTPISTLFSFVFITFLFTFALIKKNSNPLMSFAILFYFAAHLLESTFIPLELYFEHRNYLPAMFLALFLSKYLIIYIIFGYVTIICINVCTYKSLAKFFNCFIISKK